MLIFYETSPPHSPKLRQTFFFDKYRKYIKGQRPSSIQDVYKSASKREHKNKDPYPPLSGRYPLKKTYE